MRIAFCLTGLIGGKMPHGQGGCDQEILELGYKHYKKHIFDANPDCEIDVFCHSADVEFEDEINRLYQPKKSLYIEQPEFNIPEWVGGESIRKTSHYHKWFSHKKVMELRKEYEQEIGCEYDFVYIGRYDIAWTTDIIFKNLNLNKFYITNWNRLSYKDQPIENADWYKMVEIDELMQNGNPQYEHITSKLVGYPYNNEGIMDSWFISNPKYMDILCQMYDNLDEYTKPGKIWMEGKSTVCDYNGKISNHRLIPYQLELNGIFPQHIEFKYYLHDDFPLIRRLYFKTRR